MGRADIAERARSIAAALLAERQYVASVDVQQGLGWLNANDCERWRKGRVESLERVAQANLGKISAAMRELRTWASDAGLRPSETDYLARADTAGSRARADCRAPKHACGPLGRGRPLEQGTHALRTALRPAKVSSNVSMNLASDARRAVSRSGVNLPT